MSIFTTHQNNLSISCDNCGETFEDRMGLTSVADDEVGQTQFNDEEDANDVAQRNGWIIEGAKHTCPDCLNN